MCGMFLCDSNCCAPLVFGGICQMILGSARGDTHNHLLLAQRCFNAGPTSVTLAQHWNNVVPMSVIRWSAHIHLSLESERGWQQTEASVWHPLYFQTVSRHTQGYILINCLIHTGE